MVWDNVSVKMAIGGKCVSPFLQTTLLVLFAFWQRARAALFCRAFWLLLSDCKSNEEESYFLKQMLCCTNNDRIMQTPANLYFRFYYGICLLTSTGLSTSRHKFTYQNHYLSFVMPRVELRLPVAINIFPLWGNNPFSVIAALFTFF